MHGYVPDALLTTVKHQLISNRFPILQHLQLLTLYSHSLTQEKNVYSQTTKIQNTHQRHHQANSGHIPTIEPDDLGAKRQT